MSTKFFNILISVLFFSLSIFLIKSTSLDYIVDGRPLFSEFTQDKTANYVRVIAYFMAFLSVLLLIKSLMSTDVKKIILTKNPKHFYTLIIAITLYIILLPLIGFFISTALFLPITMIALGYRNKKLILLSTVFVLIFIYILFVSIFEVPLPELTIFQEQ